MPCANLKDLHASQGMSRLTRLRCETQEKKKRTQHPGEENLLRDFHLVVRKSPRTCAEAVLISHASQRRPIKPSARRRRTNPSAAAPSMSGPTDPTARFDVLFAMSSAH